VNADFFRASKYLIMRDGTALSSYIYSLKPLEELNANPSPLLWSFDRYHSVLLHSEGLSESRFSSSSSSKNYSFGSKNLILWLQTILNAGYIVSFVDVRGSGASFGYSNWAFGPEEALDSYDIVESFSSESWCNGKIGMFGRSYKGITQLFASAKPHPNLKVICPEMAYGDLYAFAFCGGIFRNDFIYQWNRRVQYLALKSKALPVDQDFDATNLRQAQIQHYANKDNYEALKGLRFRNASDKESGEKIYETRSPLMYKEAISRENLPMLHISGWFDLWIKDALLMFKNFSNDQQLIIGPWAHQGCQGVELANLHVKWFDNWLSKNRQKHPKKSCIHYFTMGETVRSPWKKTCHWPLKNQVSYKLYCSHSDSNIQNGTLQKKVGFGGCRTYQVNPTCTSGKATRWTNGYGGEFSYPDMSENEAKSCCFTSEKSKEKMEITGHPLVTLWLSTKNTSIDCFVYLSDVYPDGFSQYITEGQIKLSHRKLSKPPYDTFGLPYHSGLQDDLLPPCEEPEEVIIDLLPTSYVISKEHSLRISMNAADINNAELCEQKGEFRIYYGKRHPSNIQLPMLPIE